MAPESMMLKNIFITVLIIASFVIGGSYGYHLADERIGKFIQANAIDSALFYYEISSEIILAIEQGNNTLAIQKLESLKGAETVLFQSCLNYDCPEEIRQKIESVYKP
jgi:hypothetical protein